MYNIGASADNIQIILVANTFPSPRIQHNGLKTVLLLLIINQ